MAQSQYALTNAELANLANNAGGVSSDNYKNFVKYLIAQQGDKFLENTISSTYVLLNADNYQALLDSYSREGARVGSQITNAKAVRARLTDARVSSDWHREDRYAGSQALAAVAVGVPLAGLVYDYGQLTAASVVVGITAVVAVALYSVAAVRTHRDPAKRYWAPPGSG